MLKICLRVTHPTDFCIIFIHFYYGKSESICLKKKKKKKKKKMTRVKLFEHSSYDTWFCIKS